MVAVHNHSQIQLQSWTAYLTANEYIYIETESKSKPIIWLQEQLPSEKKSSTVEPASRLPLGQISWPNKYAGGCFIQLN